MFNFQSKFCSTPEFAKRNISMTSRNRIRKYDKSHAEIILRVRQFFEREREGGETDSSSKSCKENLCSYWGLSQRGYFEYTSVVKQIRK